MTLSSHIISRSLQAATTKSDDRISALGMLIFLLTCLGFSIMLFLVNYTLANVITTLCMIESPETTPYVPVDDIEPADGPPAYAPTDASEVPINANAETEPDAANLSSPNKPVTSSIRQSLHHLRARGGRFAYVRGLSMFLVWKIVSGIIVGTLSAIFHRNRLGVAFAAIIAETALAQWHLTWIHIVISEPSQKRWYQRVPPFRTWPKIAPSVAIWSLANQITTVLPMLITGSFGPMKHLKDPQFEPDKKDVYAVSAQAFMAILLMLALFVLVFIPATVTVVRVAASMLPEEDETLVPFDRSFGGKTTPAIVGGQGKIGIVEAWASYEWASRVRLVKLLAKITTTVLALWFVFTVVAVVEARVLFGNNLGEAMKIIHGVAGPR